MRYNNLIHKIRNLLNKVVDYLRSHPIKEKETLNPNTINKQWMSWKLRRKSIEFNQELTLS